MLLKLNEEIGVTKSGLKEKISPDWLVKVPRVNLHEIDSFGLVHLVFNTEMHPRLGNETDDAKEETRQLEKLIDPLDLI